MLILSMLVNWRPVHFFNFRGTPTPEEHKTIFFSGFKINEMTLSDESDFRHFLTLEDDLPEFHQFRNTTILNCLFPVKWPYGAML
jgi:hypothetical protein